MEDFKNSISKAAKQFKQIDKNKTIRIVSHYDCDGIAACSILVKALSLDNRKHLVSIMEQLSREKLEKLRDENYKYYVFTDLGSGQLSAIKEILNEKTVFILDHHQPEKAGLSKNITHINPHLFGIDGSRDISGAGVVYLFVKELDSCKDSLAHLAVIGAIGDIQEKNGLNGLNKTILEEAVAAGLIKVEPGLRIFGTQTRPLHKVLEYSTDPFIPGVTGNESSAVMLLNKAGINPKNKDNNWKTYAQLNKEEQKKLIAAVIMARVYEENPEDVLGQHYTLLNEVEGTLFRDAREFSTLLNSCGRLMKASLGIGVCLGDKRLRAKAKQNLVNYRKEIVNAMKWFEEQEEVIKGNNYMIINAEDNILHSVAGTMASMLVKSNDYKKGFIIMSLARTPDNMTKVSLRIAGNPDGIDLRDIIREITGKIGIKEAGGHQHAAGALIPTKYEKEFITASKETLENAIC